MDEGDIWTGLPSKFKDQLKYRGSGQEPYAIMLDRQGLCIDDSGYGLRVIDGPPLKYYPRGGREHSGKETIEVVRVGNLYESG